MRTGKYSLITILEDEGLEQFVIPEIQRDYVWSINDIKDFFQYIIDGFHGDQSDIPYLGFIYAYNDRDYPYKYILIDGQQRLTTIFLVLLAAHHKIGKGLPEYMFTRGQLKVEYKVRQSTSDFMESLVAFCANNPGVAFKVRDQIWYHKEYDSDRSIQNIINNFITIRKWLQNMKEELPQFVRYLEEEVTLSYFDIEEARQGEDLYIYMNSRGRQLEPNETLKARYLATTDEKDRWGTEWENWQDFFWKHKATRPDADAGFNDFLKMVQVLSMSSNSVQSEAISNFISGKTDSDPTFELLPNTIDELGKIYEAYQWLVNSPLIAEMYQSVGQSKNYLTVVPRADQRQVYLLRILPVIAFIYVSGCTEEITILRFARFFYNLGRKSDSIGKDISNQLPGAIRLMLEYAAKEDGEFDVCDLIDYSTRRTTLINREEIIKLTAIKVSGERREEVEELFWTIEDHYIFDGEIELLVTEYINEHYVLDFEGLTDAWEAFHELFAAPNTSKIAIALLYYGNTWFQSSPHYYQNYDCMDWKQLVHDKKGVYLLNLIKDLVQNSGDIDQIITVKMNQYFTEHNLTSIDALKSEERFFNQIAILAALDYHTDNAFFSGRNRHMAKETNSVYKKIQFFSNKAVLYNVSRYIGDGNHGILMTSMKEILNDDTRLAEIIDLILNTENVEAD
jgi:uncharacterized protein with ParB-like and HNH nuclease domain